MKKKIETDVLIAGGSASGFCAAIQAARSGVQVILVEESPWLGGMLTSAGVSAIDGNHRLPSGLWGEFRQHLYDFYGGPKSVETGWVSNTQFEPHIGDEIIQWMVEKEDNIEVIHGFRVIGALTKGNQVLGARFENDARKSLEICAKISIDATEYGDLLAYAGCEYKIGRESKRETKEKEAPDLADEIIQDITYVAILKDYGLSANKTIAKPQNYDPENYQCTCKELCNDPDFKVADCKTMLNYGRLPNNKFMINWPINGNDFYLNVTELDYKERLKALQDAKNFTLGWIYHIQTKADYKHLGLADDEYPTPDLLPFIPYIRESRRLKGVVQLTTSDIINPYNALTKNIYQTGIAVGDYPLDHHHFKAPKPVIENFPKIPAFNVPYGCLVPKIMNGLLVAEKSISVTHLVNGCTRLQPVVMQVGQAAGAAAAICVKDCIQPRNVNIRQLQQKLLDAKMWLMPFLDTEPKDWAFQSIQRIGLCGLMRGECLPREWANEMWFHTEKNVTFQDALEALRVALEFNNSRPKKNQNAKNKEISRAEAVKIIWTAIGKPQETTLRQYFNDVAKDHFAYDAIQYFNKQGWLKQLKEVFNFLPKKKIKRFEFAYLLDCTLNPFVDHPIDIIPEAE